MAGDLSGYLKIDVALPPSTGSAASEHISEYFDMSGYDKAIFIVQAGSMTASGDVDLRLLSGHTSTGSAIAVGVHTTINGTPTDATTITGATRVIVAGTSQECYDGKTITVNGVTYTFDSSSGGTAAAATSDFAATRLVWASTDAALPSASLHHLAAYINHATYGVTGVVATVSAATCHVILDTDPPGEAHLDVSVSSSAIQLYGKEWVGYLELTPAELSVTSSQRYVAVGATPSTVQFLSAALIRGGARFSPTQYVAGSMSHTT